MTTTTNDYDTSWSVQCTYANLVSSNRRCRLPTKCPPADARDLYPTRRGTKSSNTQEGSIQNLRRRNNDPLTDMRQMLGIMPESGRSDEPPFGSSETRQQLGIDEELTIPFKGRSHLMNRNPDDRV